MRFEFEWVLIGVCACGHQRRTSKSHHTIKTHHHKQQNNKNKQVKGLREALSAAGNEAADLEANAQHLRRQQANLQDRIKKLEGQVRVFWWLCVMGVCVCCALPVRV